MNSLLVTASDQYTEKILAYQEQEKVEIAQLKKDRLYLLKQIDEMKEDKCSLEVQVRRIPAHPHVKALAFRELWEGCNVCFAYRGSKVQSLATPANRISQ